MTNPTMFDPIALENWYSDDENSLLLQTELEKYFQNYLPCFRSEPQRKLFQTFITGLLSPLERKSIEPVALHFSGEKYVRPMQQFFSRSPFEEQPLLDIYQELLSKQVGQAPGMLSVDDTCFVKKRETFRRGEAPVLRPPRQNGKLPVRRIPCFCGGQRVRPCGL